MAKVIEILEALGKIGAREAETGLKGLQIFKPVQYLDDAARGYGSGSDKVSFVVASPRQTEELGRWYADAPSFDLNPATDAAYKAMYRDTQNQFDFLTRPVRRGGLGVDVSVTSQDPYKVHTLAGVRSMLDDLGERRLKVLSTESTGGHPYFDNDTNDMFRAVHDAFGHAATGRGFNAHGEEAAYRAHSRMFSPEARPALATETRAQNAFVNKYGRFGDQKVVLLPERMADINAFPLTEDELAQIYLSALARLGTV